MNVSNTGEVVVGLGAPIDAIPDASAIRSTTLISSIAAVEAAGKLDEYKRLLPREHVDTLLQMVTGAWMPMEVGVAHYATVERLGFSPMEARQNGRRVAQNVQASHFATVVRALGSTVTLWSVLPRFPAFLGRLVRGGAVAVYKLGPKDGRIELHGIPIARFAYVRNGWAGMFEGTFELVARKVYARDLSAPSRPHSAIFALSWV